MTFTETFPIRRFKPILRVGMLGALCGLGHAVASPVLWDQTVGGTASDYAANVTPTSDGGYIVGGTSASGYSGNKKFPLLGPSTPSKGDIWVIKYDLNHKEQWQAVYGGTDTSNLEKIRQTSDGGYVIGAVSNCDDSGDFTENTHGGFDYWVIKLDAHGTIQWQKSYGGNADDIMSDILQTKDGGYIMVGSSTSGASGDKTGGNFSGSYYVGDRSDYWIVKIDSQGNKQWDKTYGGNLDDWASAVALSPDGGYLVFGESESDISGSKSENDRHGGTGERGDFWLLRLDSKGNKIWDRTYGGQSVEGSRDMKIVDAGKSAILFGYSYSEVSGEKTQPSKGSSDFWIVKVDFITGNVLWDRAYGGNGLEWAGGMEVALDGSGYIFAGATSSSANQDVTDTGRGYDDYWVVKTDVNGIKLWARTIGGTLNDDAMSICTEVGGKEGKGYLITGYSDSNMGGDKSENDRDISGATIDYWQVKIAP